VLVNLLDDFGKHGVAGVLGQQRRMKTQQGLFGS
jgi:hypothetical protein